MATREAPCGTEAAVAELRQRLCGWRPDQVGTLMFVAAGERLLLIRKRRGHGAGKINGPGGKPRAGESPLACVLRETEEEVGVRPHDPELAAVLRFVDSEDADWLGYVFRARSYAGTPRDSAEALVAWYPLDALPFEEMWGDDRYWLPRVLAGERLRGDFLFRGGVLEAHQLQHLDAGEGFGADQPHSV